MQKKRNRNKKRPQVKILKTDPKRNILAKPGGLSDFVNISYDYIKPVGILAHIVFWFQLPRAYYRYKKIYETKK